MPDLAAGHMDPRPGDRLKLVGIYAAAIGATIAFRLLWPGFVAQSRGLPDCGDLQGTRAVLVGYAVLLSFAAAIAARRGLRVLAAGRVPLATDAVFIRTTIRTGFYARVEALTCFVAACVLAGGIGAFVALFQDSLGALFAGFPGSASCG